jgi:pyruvate ferredoxin oxidoreductase alpha subunit
VRKFLGEYNPRHLLLDPERPMSLGIFANESYVTEYRYQQQQAMENAKAVIHESGEEYGRKFGRSLGGLVNGFMLEDAEVGIVAMGSMCSQVRRIVLAMRETGVKAGAIKVRVFRPFPREELQKLARHLKLLCVVDRDVSIGSGGILHSEVATAMHPLRAGPRTVNFIMGLSGREVTDRQFMNLISEAYSEVENESNRDPVRWVGVRE